MNKHSENTSERSLVVPRVLAGAAAAVATIAVCLGAPAAEAAERVPAAAPMIAASRVHASIPVIADATLKTAVIGLDYSDTVPGSGTGTLIFTTAGPLPPGLTLAPSGALTGKPTATASASFSFVVRITNSDGSATATITVPVRSAVGPSVASATLAPATIGTPYSQSIAASGDGKLTVTALSPLPPGLSLAPSGAILGTPLATTQKSFDVKVHVTSDSVTGYADATITIPIANPLSAPVITSGVPAAGVVGQPYSFTVTAAGEPKPTFSLTAGALPRGLQLDPQTGVISGTPVDAKATSFTVSATNAAGSAAADLSISITAAPVTTTTTPTTATTTATGSSAGSAGSGGSAGRAALAETGADLAGVPAGATFAAMLLAVGLFAARFRRRRGAR